MRAEIVVVVLGLIVGYCLISYLMRGASPDRTPKRRAGRAPGSAWAEAAQAPAGRYWFEVLGVSEAASREEIEGAYRRNIGQYHPDKVVRLGEDIQRLAEQRSKEINAAYDEGMRRF